MDPGRTSITKKQRRGEFEATVAAVHEFSSDLRSITIALIDQAADCFSRAKAGQFVQLACRELGNPRCPTPLLRRPFSIAGLQTENDRVLIEVMYRVMGPGTTWLAGRGENDSINVMGPLGNGFSLPKDPTRQSILVGGGVGLPPMFFLADKLAELGIENITAYAGARDKTQFVASLCPVPDDPGSAAVAAIEQFNRSKTGCVLATDDGSLGYHGLILDPLDRYLTECDDRSGIDLYACGPGGMLRAISRLAEKFDLPCQICMEAYMSCGIGLCQSCVVQTKTHQAKKDQPNYKLVCTNGPVFDSRSVIWGE